ncbi:MAG: hypothetical protein ACLU38_12780 [Dysosmobacter sp.]
MIVAFLFQSVVPIGFGLIPLFALYGGIGWSVPVATIFEEEGYWTNAVPVAITIATIGVVCGIVFGIVMVNIGIRKGLIKHTTASLDDLPRSSVPDTLPLKAALHWKRSVQILIGGPVYPSAGLCGSCCRLCPLAPKFFNQH